MRSTRIWRCVNLFLRCLSLFVCVCLYVSFYLCVCLYLLCVYLCLSVSRCLCHPCVSVYCVSLCVSMCQLVCGSVSVSISACIYPSLPISVTLPLSLPLPPPFLFPSFSPVSYLLPFIYKVFAPIFEATGADMMGELKAVPMQVHVLIGCSTVLIGCFRVHEASAAADMQVR